MMYEQQWYKTAILQAGAVQVMSSHIIPNPVYPLCRKVGTKWLYKQE